MKFKDGDRVKVKGTVNSLIKVGKITGFDEKQNKYEVTLDISGWFDEDDLEYINPDCGSSSCRYSRNKGGMRTNSRCRCAK